MKKNVLIIASGTGGHVIPAKNISQKLIKMGYEVTWVGTRFGIENKLLADENIKIRHVHSSGIRGMSVIKTIRGILNLLTSFFQSLIIIYKEKPLFVFGFGGYITVPVSIAAYVMRIPVYAHESNSIPGTANKINNLISSLTFQTFPKTFLPRSKIILSGNPIKDSFLKIIDPQTKYSEKKNILNILVFGGSQGAKFLNYNIPKCLSRFPGKFEITHITGKNDTEVVKTQYDDYGLSAKVLNFSNEMEKLYDWSDIIISRAGSMTVSEISKSGRAAILVPFLHATDNHQYFNAKYLEENKAAIIIEEDKNFISKLSNNLSEFYKNQDLLCELAMNGKNLFPNDSNAIIISKISELNEELNNTTSKE